MDESKFRDFEAADFLDNEEVIAAYITDAMQDPDPDALLSALADVARAKAVKQ